MMEKEEKELHLPRVDLQASVRDAVKLMTERDAAAVAGRQGDNVLVYSIDVLGKALDLNVDVGLPEVTGRIVDIHALRMETIEEIVVAVSDALRSMRIAPLDWICPKRRDFSWSSARDCPNCGVPLVPRRP